MGNQLEASFKQSIAKTNCFSKACSLHFLSLSFASKQMKLIHRGLSFLGGQAEIPDV